MRSIKQRVPLTRAMAPSCLGPSALAEALLAAWADETAPRLILEGPSCSVETLDDVFAVHDAMIASPRAAQLGGLRGYKLGWKRHPLLLEHGMAAIYAPIFGKCVLESGPVAPTVSLSQHGIYCAEAEYGFHIGGGLPPSPSRGYTPAEVLAAVTRVDLCLELCGTRLALAAPPIATASPYLLLADAMCNALVVCGPSVTALAAHQLTTAKVSIEADGHLISSGDGRENPEDSPVCSLVWFVNDLTHRRRRPLPTGALIIAGHTCQAVFNGRPAPESAALLPQLTCSEARSQPSATPVATRLTARFEGLGTVEASIIP